MAIRLPRRLRYLVLLAVLGVVIYGSVTRRTADVVQEQVSTLNAKTADAFKKAADAWEQKQSSLEEEKTPEIPRKRPDVKVTEPTVDRVMDQPKNEAKESEVSAATKAVNAPIRKPAPTLTPVPVVPIFANSAVRDNGQQVPTLPIVSKGLAQNAAPGATEDPSLSRKFQLDRREHHPVPREKMYKLPSDKPKRLPKIQTTDPSLTESAQEKEVRTTRQQTIKDAFARDWSAYRRYAWMHDELTPVSNGSHDPFGGWGATLVDSLDTLLIMGLLDEYAEASSAVAKIDFTFTKAERIPIFETTIRYLGGLLGAYDVGVSQGRKDPIMLKQAKILAQVLYGAFDTPNRLPILQFDYRLQEAANDPESRAPTGGCMAEIGSLSVEFTRLAQLSEGLDRDKYYDAIQKITDALEESTDSMLIPGLWPLVLDLSGCKPDADSYDDPAIDRDTTAIAKRSNANTTICEPQGIRAPPGSGGEMYSQGGMADSTYEYLTKEYLLLGGVPAADQYKRMYEMSIAATKQWLIYKPMVPGNLGAKDILMSGEVLAKKRKKPAFHAKMQHLTCFIGGMVGMGAKVFDRPEEMKLAERLTDGCVWAYEQSAIGVAPETFHMHECKDETCDWDAFVEERLAAMKVEKEEQEKKAREQEELRVKQEQERQKQDEERRKTESEERRQAAERKSQERLREQDSARQAEADRNVRQADSQEDTHQRVKRDADEPPNEAVNLAAQNFRQSQDEKAHVVTTAPKVEEAVVISPLYWIDSRYILRPEAVRPIPDVEREG